ncbi:MAG: ABC transporter permease subunit [Dysgonamonadaceae bacterium]|jgi:phosphate transport system permease protein|nr:ABC transporter permease subunit [Dysgonamonadaceae bacterium]
MIANKNKYRTSVKRLSFCLVHVLSFLALLPFILLLFSLIKNGKKHLSVDFFTSSTPSISEISIALTGPESIPGGILNGLSGGFFIIIIAVVIYVPIGMMAAVYFFNYRNTKPGLLLHYSVIILSGLPSIIIGICTYLWIVRPFYYCSAFAGGVALAIAILPGFILSVLHIFEQLPQELRVTGTSLGLSYTRIMLKLVIPYSKIGLISVVLSSLSKGIGKTTPLIFTTLWVFDINRDLFQTSTSLSLLVWRFFHEPYMTDFMWSAALLLLIIVLTLSLISERFYRNWIKEIKL